MLHQLPMRRGVGVLLLHPDDPTLVLTGLRIEREADASPQWQWPQGGRKKRETPKQTAHRESREEIGVRGKDMKFLGFLPKTTSYEYPAGMRPRPYRGQVHKWAVFRYKRAGIPDLRYAHSMDFSQLRWETVAWTRLRTAEFRRPSYVQVEAMLAEFLA
jgi:putative (di)nucleoside polyphosphate hydrolase